VAEALFGISISMHNITNSNALLLYKVGPVLVCTPTLYIESITIPPNLNSLPGSSHAEPGMFKSMHGMVRVVDLRVRFGVDDADRKSPGRIIISETTGGYVGLWVDEIEDVISFPEKGWSQLPAHVPREAFSRALICDKGIRLYADIENLDKFKATGYLRAHIESIKAKNVSENKTEKNDPVVISAIREKTENKQEKEAVSKKTSGEKNTAVPHESSTIEKPATYDIKPRSNAVEKNKSTVIKNIGRDGKKIDKKIAEIRRKDSEGKDNKGYVGVSPVVRNTVIPVDNKSDGFDKNSNSEIRRIQSNEYSASPVLKEMKRVENEPKSDFLWVSILALSFIAVSAYVVEFSGVFDIDGGSIAEDGNRRGMFVEEEYVHVSNDSYDYSLNEDNEVNEVNEVNDYSGDTVDISKTDEGIVIVINDYDESLSEEEFENYKTSVEESLEVDVEDITVTAVQSIENVNKELAVHSTVTEASEKNDDNYVNIVAAQDDNSNALKADAKLQRPNAKSKEEVVNAIVKTRTSVHIVIAGDTLWDIAKKYVNNPWKYPELARLSKIEDPDLIYPGQKVIIIYHTNK